MKRYITADALIRVPAYAITLDTLEKKSYVRYTGNLTFPSDAHSGGSKGCEEKREKGVRAVALVGRRKRRSGRNSSEIKMTVQQYCLRWNNHQPNFISVFSSLLNSQSLVDVTLAAEGTHLQAHKVVLSACSSYFQVMVDFMYHGEVNVSQEQLPCILKTAEMLKIKEPGSGDIILSTMDNVFGTVTKVETDRYSTDSTTSAPTTPQQQHHQQQQPQKCNGVPVPSIQAGPSHEIQEQSPTQEIPHMGPKRGRFLMRQPRIKRESDPSQEPSEGGEPPMASTSHYLTVPPIRIERQCSDPTPSVSPSPENLLHVQEHVLVKQHSHPLLPTKSPEEYHKCPRPSSSEPPSSTVVTSPTSQTTSVLQGSPTKTFPKNS
ncbi:unnamed protein product [Callosobruchus maculatus]|uniref:BTB domain-containing protein n=1 Tax=Callosobruchus maculatus TaxID=64391 RepID=A0A653C2A2_CALMS|nr:unnamed protein product [Callosobruchus maculatus]